VFFYNSCEVLLKIALHALRLSHCGNKMRFFRMNNMRHHVLRAKELRNNMTPAERKLWSVLRARQCGGMRFRRQYPFGPYILDFACLEKRLAIELDGSQHGETIRYDDERTQRLNRHGWRLLRFWNHEVMLQPDAVFAVIMAAREG
jgi:very-short-patch-repair endonuclease